MPKDSRGAASHNLTLKEAERQHITEALEILCSLRRRLEVRRDCLACKIYEARESEGEILYLEQWRSSEALNRHIQSPLYILKETTFENTKLSVVPLN